MSSPYVVHEYRLAGAQTQSLKDHENSHFSLKQCKVLADANGPSQMGGMRPNPFAFGDSLSEPLRLEIIYVTAPCVRYMVDEQNR
jgi:hypothetical protein